MLVSLAALFPLLASALAAAVPHPRDAVKGTIEVPTAGTAIAPGSNFTFTYTPRADYGVSTYFYHVFLMDEAATVGALPPMPINVFSTGYYFGRFDYPNYPAVPYPKNECPTQLTMPDFAVSPGGWATGMSASNRKMQLVVVEEWGNASPVGLGRNFGVTMTEIVYNATTTSVSTSASQ